jgi:hypothetical protein
VTPEQHPQALAILRDPCGPERAAAPVVTQPTALDAARLSGHPDSMARYSGGPITHAALTGPKPRRDWDTDESWKNQLTSTLQAVRTIRQKCDRTELETVRQARLAGMSWTEIATALGVTRQSAWERWHELDGTAER